MIDKIYSPGKNHKRRYCREWLAYVDDLTIRTGRVLDGCWYTDEEYAARIASAAKSVDAVGYQSAKEALEAQGFLAKDLGVEVAEAALVPFSAGKVGVFRMQEREKGPGGEDLKCRAPGADDWMQMEHDMHGKHDQLQVYLCMRTRADSRRVVCHTRTVAALGRDSLSSRFGQDRKLAGEGRCRAMASSSSWWPQAPQQQQGAGRGQRERGRPERPASWRQAQEAPRGASWRGRGWHAYVREVGKCLVTALRHDPRNELLGRMDTAGFVKVEDLIEIPSVARYMLTEHDVEEIVDEENQGKVRFVKFRDEGGSLWLRAAQGHSTGVGSSARPGAIKASTGR